MKTRQCLRYALTFSLFCLFLRAAAFVSPVQSSSAFTTSLSFGICCRRANIGATGISFLVVKRIHILL